MTARHTYQFKVTALSPLRVGPGMPDSITSIIPAASLRGTLRGSYARWLETKAVAIHRDGEGGGPSMPGFCFDPERVFGTDLWRGAVWVSDLILDKGGNSTQIVATLDGAPVGGVEVRVTHAIEAGSLLKGRISFESQVPGIVRSVVLNALLGIQEFEIPVGGGGARGFGRVAVSICEAPAPSVFIIYKHGSPERMTYAMSLAATLADSCHVMFDQFEIEPTEKPPAPEIEHWMSQNIVEADRVLCLLTPDFKVVAASPIGGLGYEYRLLRTQQAVLFESLKRVICVLLEGDPEASTPPALVDAPLVDLRDGNVTGVREILDLLHWRDTKGLV